MPREPIGEASVYRQLRLCSNRGGFEAVPDPPRTVDLEMIRHRLERDGIAVVDARVMLIVGLDPEVTISRNGRLLVKTRDAAAARRSFERIESLLAEDRSAPATRRPGSG